MGFGDNCNTGLVLGLGFSDDDHQEKKNKNKISNVIPLNHQHYLFPSDLTLGPSTDEIMCWSASAPRKINDLHQDSHQNQKQQQQQQQQASSPSTNSNSVKKEREFEEVEVERGSSRVMISDEDEEGSPRKKLRLTKEQSVVLEDSFKEQSTLNPKQKQALAEQLNLRPRQVEVWFQNRRARTKLKQTEVDCELLKKCCETLTEENKRLQKELQELKSLNMNNGNTAPFYAQLPVAALTLCPSCDRIGTGTAATAAGGDASSKTDFSIEPKLPHHFYNPFNHPSAACY